MIVQTKFDDCAIGLRYQSGTLVAAFIRSGKDVTKAARTICNLPLELPSEKFRIKKEHQYLINEEIDLIGSKENVNRL